MIQASGTINTGQEQNIVCTKKSTLKLIGLAGREMREDYFTEN